MTFDIMNNLTFGFKNIILTSQFSNVSVSNICNNTNIRSQNFC